MIIMHQNIIVTQLNNGIILPLKCPLTHYYNVIFRGLWPFKLYAVKAQTSLAPLSRFRGSRVTTAHAQECCRFQSYAKIVPSRMKLTMKLTKHEPHSWDPRQRTTWSRRVTSDFNSVLTWLEHSVYILNTEASRLQTSTVLTSLDT